jgi:hypothetical protein
MWLTGKTIDIGSIRVAERHVKVRMRGGITRVHSAIDWLPAVTMTGFYVDEVFYDRTAHVKLIQFKQAPPSSINDATSYKQALIEQRGIYYKYPESLIALVQSKLIVNMNMASLQVLTNSINGHCKDSGITLGKKLTTILVKDSMVDNRTSEYTLLNFLNPAIWMKMLLDKIKLSIFTGVNFTTFTLLFLVLLVPAALYPRFRIILIAIFAMITTGDWLNTLKGFLVGPHQSIERLGQMKDFMAQGGNRVVDGFTKLLDMVAIHPGRVKDDEKRELMEGLGRKVIDADEAQDYVRVKSYVDPYEYDDLDENEMNSRLTILGPTGHELPYELRSKDPVHLAASIVTRQCLAKPLEPPTDWSSLFCDRHSEWIDAVNASLPSLAEWFTPDDWYAKQKTSTKTAIDILEEEGDVDMSCSKPYKVFQKSGEKPMGLDSETKARTICACPTTKKMLAGYYTTLVSKAILSVQEQYYCENRERHLPFIYATGLTPTELGVPFKKAWVSSCLNGDVTAFEGSQHPNNFKFVSLLYAKFGVPHDICMLTRDKCTAPRLHQDVKMKYEWGQNSGDVDTTLSNSIINGCSARYAADKLGIAGAIIIVAGDDYCILTPEPEGAVAIGQRRADEFGWLVKEKLAVHPAQISFISARLVPVAGLNTETIWVAVPTLGKTLPKLFTSKDGHRNENPLGVIKGVLHAAKTVFDPDSFGTDYLDNLSDTYQMHYSDWYQAKIVDSDKIFYNLITIDTKTYSCRLDQKDWLDERYGPKARVAFETLLIEMDANGPLATLDFSVFSAVDRS